MSKKKEALSSKSAITRVELHHVDASDYFTGSDEIYFIPIPPGITDHLGWSDNDQRSLKTRNRMRDRGSLRKITYKLKYAMHAVIS